MDIEGLIVHVYNGTAYAYRVGADGVMRRVTRDGYRYFNAHALTEFAQRGIEHEVIQREDYEHHNDEDALAYVEAVATMDRIATGKDKTHGAI
jgi:hypothetical protein